MYGISASELELQAFFECEPKLHAPDVPWLFNEAFYEFFQGDFSLACAIGPACKDIHLLLRYQTQTLYELDATNVADVRYHKGSDRDALEIEFDEQIKLWVRLRPTIFIGQEMRK